MKKILFLLLFAVIGFYCTYAQVISIGLAPGYSTEKGVTTELLCSFRTVTKIDILQFLKNSVKVQECIVPEPFYTYQPPDGIRLDNRYNFSLINNSVVAMRISSLQMNDMGTWECRIQGTVGKNYQLEVKVPVNFVQMTAPNVDPVIVAENIASTFICQTSGSIPMATVKWFQDSRTPDDFADDIEITRNVSSTASSAADGSSIVTSSLKYVSVRTDVGLRIYCETQNLIGHSAAISVLKPKLIVKYGPDFPCENASVVVEVTEGENLKMRCIIDCFPGCTYTWTNANSVVGTGTVLFLKNIRRHQAGNYTFGAMNTAPDYAKSSTRTFNVMVKYSPVVTARLSSLNHSEGSKLTIFCDGEGVPASYYYTGLIQTAGEVEIPNTNTALEGTETSSSIHFPFLRLQDTGNYTCKMNNGIRDISGTLDQTASVEMLVEGVPSIPKMFSFIEPLFIWEKGFNGGHIQTFIVQLSIINTGDWKTFATISESDERYKINETIYGVNITGLKPGTYTARLVVKNSIGETVPLNLNATFVIVSENVSTVEHSNLAVIVGVVVSAVVGVLVVLGVIVVWRGICRRGCRKGIANEREQDNGVHENSYYNLGSSADDTKAYSVLMNRDRGSFYSELQVSGGVDDQANYERLQESRSVTDFTVSTQITQLQFRQ